MLLAELATLFPLEGLSRLCSKRTRSVRRLSAKSWTISSKTSLRELFGSWRRRRDAVAEFAVRHRKLDTPYFDFAT